MYIKKVSIISSKTNKTYNFGQGMNLIYSRENSMGKTTMIRFILYALGYQIPETERIGQFSRFITEIEVETNDGLVIIRRHGENAKIFFNNEEIEFKLPLEEKELLDMIFSIKEPSVSENLLGSFYIDQEKGWTMLNRGKVIGNIRFNIEEFVAGLTDKNICDLMDEKKTISENIRKYRLANELINMDDHRSDVGNTSDLLSKDYNKLQARKDEIEAENNRIIHKIKIIKEAIKSNGNFVELIYDLGIGIVHDGEEIRVTKDNLSIYDVNQKLLKKKLRIYEIEKKKNSDELNLINDQLNRQSTFLDIKTIMHDLECEIKKYSINGNLLTNIVNQMAKKRECINSHIKDTLITGNLQLQKMFETIHKYATKLGVVEYVSVNDPRFVLTNKLKGLSGRVLAQLAFVFRLAYINAIKEKYHICLPIVIDSPRAAELSEKSTLEMLRILLDDFSEHQIILASIYKIQNIEINTIDLNNGFLDFLKKDELPLLQR